MDISGEVIMVGVLVPKKITAKDLVAKNPSDEVKAIYDRALKHAYEDQQKLLEKAKKLS